MSLDSETREATRKKFLSESVFGPTVDELFKEGDVDKSGYIERSELNASELKKLLSDLGKTLGLPSPTEATVDSELKRLDLNGDGKISKKEFRQLVKELINIIVDNM